MASDTLPASASQLLRFSGVMAMFIACPLIEKHIAALARLFARGKLCSANTDWLMNRYKPAMAIHE